MANVPTNLQDVQALIQTDWAPLLMGELRETALLPRLINTEYSPLILNQNDTIKVNMLKAATGQTLTINKTTGAHKAIEAEKLVIVSTEIKADKIFTASFELDNLTGLMTELDPANIGNESPIRNALVQSLEKQINEFIFGKVAPHTSGVVKGVSAFTFAEFKKITKAASKLKWPKDGRVLLLDPEYYTDLSSEEKMSSADYVGTDLPMLDSSNAMSRSGFLIAEDNTDGLLTLADVAADGKAGIAFHKNFFYFVAQTIPTFKISDQHAAGKRGYLITVDLVGGGALGIEGDKKHITINADTP